MSQERYKYIIQVDYGSEGWNLNGYNTEAELKEALKNINTVVYGNNFIVTKVLDYNIDIKDDEV